MGAAKARLDAAKTLAVGAAVVGLWKLRRSACVTTKTFTAGAAVVGLLVQQRPSWGITNAIIYQILNPISIYWV